MMYDKRLLTSPPYYTSLLPYISRRSHLLFLTSYRSFDGIPVLLPLSLYLSYTGFYT
ncbi:hypothetical protein BDR04DRAFT_1086948 [Suillus decipiens]|nr:hypothetical protein BDR04DRAFT_1086948 [Suillus decipiens]